MTLHHFPHRAINGAWHAVYRTPGCGSLTSIGDAGTQAGAQIMAHDANREQERKASMAAAMAVAPADRALAPGFYADAEAA